MLDRGVCAGVSTRGLADAAACECSRTAASSCTCCTCSQRCCGSCFGDKGSELMIPKSCHRRCTLPWRFPRCDWASSTRPKLGLPDGVGPPVLQPYYDLIRLARKDSVFSTTTTWVFRAGPVVSLVTAVFAALLIPLGTASAPVSFTGDLCAVGLSVCPRSLFHGHGGAPTRVRHLKEWVRLGKSTFACFAEPAFFGHAGARRNVGLASIACMLGTSATSVGVWRRIAAGARVAAAWFIVLWPRIVAFRSTIPIRTWN